LAGHLHQGGQALRGLTAIGADPAGHPWAVGSAYAHGTTAPAIINAPGIGQGGILVDSGAANATVTWTGPATGTGTTAADGEFATGGLPDGTYTGAKRVAIITPIPEAADSGRCRLPGRLRDHRCRFPKH
jgi:hypothetical protein